MTSKHFRGNDPNVNQSNEPKRAFLGMPGYGSMTAAASRGLWRARRDAGLTTVMYRQGSLLASNFNGLWCGAMNAKRHGEQIDYFAMLHDDIGPEDFWLDTLIELLETNELDLLGVAIPIKDGKGLTSLAIDGESTWAPKCRISLAELQRLPEVFTSEHVGGPLLLNTGCWVCRFDWSWIDQVHFEINDRIVFNHATDCFEAQVEPEDWFFSRLGHELNLRIGATTKVKADHRGEHNFPNYRQWGEQFDSAYVSESPIAPGV